MSRNALHQVLGSFIAHGTGFAAPLLTYVGSREQSRRSRRSRKHPTQ
jgi:hypothetical protein